jgi:hypothetical protein
MHSQELDSITSHELDVTQELQHGHPSVRSWHSEVASMCENVGCPNDSCIVQHGSVPRGEFCSPESLFSLLDPKTSILFCSCLSVCIVMKSNSCLVQQ